MMTDTIYELNHKCKLVPVDATPGMGLEVGQVLHWGGNQGWSETDYVIIAQDEGAPMSEPRGYWCFGRDYPANNARLTFVEYHSIKRRDDPSVWHKQHFFLTDEVVSRPVVQGYQEMHQAQKSAFDANQEAKRQERERLEIEGRDLWSRLIGEADYVLVAELMHDDSDIQSDYFASHATKTVILGPSPHGRNNFQEMRKAALKIPETAHLGPGRDVWTPTVVFAHDVPTQFEYYHEGRRSPWHSEMQRDERGIDVHFQTEAEAQAWSAGKGEPEPIQVDGKLASFVWEINKQSIEHRENYAGGAGYYLQDGGCHGSGWRVSKTRRGYQGQIDSGLLVALARRHDHLEQMKGENTDK